MTSATHVVPTLWQAFVMPGIGDRIAAYRKRRGLSQVVLAGLVGRSESWLSQVERGVREVDSLTAIRDLASALKVSVDALIGSPLTSISLDAEHRSADPVRRYLDGYTQLLTAPQISTETAAELAASAEQLSADYQSARYDQALEATPPLLAAVDALRHVDDSAEAIHAYIAVYVIAAKTLHKVGENRLAALAADRAATIASQPNTAAVDQGLAAREVVLGLLYAGQAGAAEALAVDMATTLQAAPHEDSDEPAVLSLRGSLLLLAAVIAARNNERYEALDRLAQAEQLAIQLGVDANHCWTAFGPTNVAIHAVSVATALGDAGEAARLFHHVDVDNLPPGLTSRRAQLHVDMAWAYTQSRRDAEATLQLLEAEHVAPQLIRYHPAIRESIRELLTRSRAGGTGILHDLAIRAGILT